MRTRNRPLLLKRAVADVCRQTFSDWHLVVVNDGGLAADVDAVLRHHPMPTGRLTLLNNEAQRGMEAASNRGIAAQKSTYVAIHDDDDTWHPSFLARTVAHLDGTSQAAVAVRTEIVRERIQGESIVEIEREIFAPQVHAFTLFEMLRTNRTVPISVLYRRAVHDTVGWFREDLPVVGDWEFFLRLTLTDLRLGFLDGEPLAFWHQRPTATGPAANSVVTGSTDHRDVDLLLRDEALRAYGQRHGLGGLLYTTAYFQREIDRLIVRLTENRHREEEAVHLLRRAAELLERQAERLDQQNDRLTALEAAVSDASLVSLARRRYRRWKSQALRLVTGAQRPSTHELQRQG
ncbi:Glycosyl transferase family 2 [Geodermatophilus obscurus]|uniref:Glycosyl transferase family 2 n=2 Tax=Geodermatophilus obscurus TaxID=1861 RepID=A0A1I5ICZ1_9ACTN|nr:Glycosyl transferase family 2 [Geodermatophilus obscurus]